MGAEKNIETCLLCKHRERGEGFRCLEDPKGRTFQCLAELHACPHELFPARGFGDTFAKLTHATGIDKAAHLLTEITGFDCGCNERRAKWNAAAPYTPPPPPPLAEAVTIGVTMFGRPRCLTRLHESIRQHYPDLHVVIADNGDKPASIDHPLTTYHRLDYDCGLSKARNFLIGHTTTPYLLIAEEDFTFTERTKLEAFLDVLHTDPDVGIVGGALYDSKRKGVVEFTGDFHVFRDTLEIEASRRPYRFTTTGTPYSYRDVIYNFALGRREFFADHRWDEALKLGEHFRFFQQVWEARKWRVAYTPACEADHDRETERAGNYAEKRQRATADTAKASQLAGYASTRTDLRMMLPRPSGTPNVVILAVGHSGTTILAKQLFALGWAAGDADEEFGESVSVRDLNDRAIAAKALDLGAATKVLAALPRQWCIKDPRFVQTLPRWLAAFAPHEPLLLLIEREAEAVRQSHARRGYPHARGGLTVEEAQAKAREHYRAWPWAKKAIRYEDLGRAAGMFDPGRSTAAGVVAGA